jgi:hypothetical protein
MTRVRIFIAGSSLRELSVARTRLCTVMQKRSSSRSTRSTWAQDRGDGRGTEEGPRSERSGTRYERRQRRVTGLRRQATPAWPAQGALLPSGATKRLAEGERLVGHLVPAMVDRERVTAVGNRLELGHAGCALPLVGRGARSQRSRRWCLSPARCLCAARRSSPLWPHSCCSNADSAACRRRSASGGRPFRFVRPGVGSSAGAERVEPLVELGQRVTLAAPPCPEGARSAPTSPHEPE